MVLLHRILIFDSPVSVNLPKEDSSVSVWNNVITMKKEPINLISAAMQIVLPNHH